MGKTVSDYLLLGPKVMTSLFVMERKKFDRIKQLITLTSDYNKRLSLHIKAEYKGPNFDKDPTGTKVVTSNRFPCRQMVGI